MGLPKPEPGLVISYAYLWNAEQRAGRLEGVKDRPVVIVVSTQDIDGDTVVLVAPITHSSPSDPMAIEIPAKVKRRLGMDDHPSWIVTSEVNRFVWPGFDLRPISRRSPNQFAWGFIPVELLARVKIAIAAQAKARRLGAVKRE